ncbi:MAG: hypothetical protein A2381_15870 [Bdellovibrionales bacterium RIFOXYB1_FULL_37_110]|nr:MAG: hypothetical protein A2417_07720 [Bdellovibrionales bacterium RIFOXYC1_FULL_37_79]OFZ57091.1 MAG: hypothetical protein A2381_15870 [Bdellovibrionales bacterium RIFOXYB1_FULL_37_110]OFZ62058.1 MAG: hypothetical protein A2577_08360 [Bdellovibrionales bacterium RIFOXYD1_FULL_36_51]
MGLTENRRLFFRIRGKCRILISSHAFKDHPERNFTKQELVNFVKRGAGSFQKNDSAMAISGSYQFLVRDDEERPCKLVILIEEEIIEGSKGGPPNKETIIKACSAYREVNNESN